ncbi:MAG: hypothetical protein V1723_03175 [Candidatus Uhrbacteria bacterium]
MSNFRYYVFLLILVIPAALIDDAIGIIDHSIIRVILRVVWIIFVLGVLGLVPKKM